WIVYSRPSWLDRLSVFFRRLFRRRSSPVPHTQESTLKYWVSRLPKQVRSRVKLIRAKWNWFYPWAQDGSKPLDDGGTLVPKSLNNGTNRPAYFSAVHAQAEAGKAPERKSPFRFEGGNIVVGERHVFVGP